MKIPDHTSERSASCECISVAHVQMSGCADTGPSYHGDAALPSPVPAHTILAFKYHGAQTVHVCHMLH